MLCVDCGAEVPHLIGGSCATCFIRKTPLLTAPEVVNLELCAHCGAKHIGAHWQDVEQDLPEEWIREEAVRAACGVHERVVGVILDTEERQLDDKTFQVGVHLEGTIDEAPVEQSLSLLLRRRIGSCDRCSRIAGGYYAAIIQLRATGRAVTEAELDRSHRLVAEDLTRQLRSGNRFAFLAKEGAIHDGWDYYLGDIDAGRNVSRLLKDRLSAQVTETAKLVGRREGNDVYRVTFLVRIKEFSPGDVLLSEGRLYHVGAVHGAALGCIDLERHLKTRVPERTAKRLGGPADFLEAVLVSQEGRDVQVLDPADYQTVTVRVPEGLRIDTETVHVFRHDERLWWVPAPNKP